MISYIPDLHSKTGHEKKQMTGIEPASSAWEADVLPMNYICMQIGYHVFLKNQDLFCFGKGAAGINEAGSRKEWI